MFPSAIGQRMIVVNSVDIATDLLEGRSSNYSDRPIFTMGGEIIDWNGTLAFTNYSPRRISRPASFGLELRPGLMDSPDRSKREFPSPRYCPTEFAPPLIDPGFEWVNPTGFGHIAMMSLLCICQCGWLIAVLYVYQPESSRYDHFDDIAWLQRQGGRRSYHPSHGE